MTVNLMDGQPQVEIYCLICDVHFALDTDSAVRVAEMHAFAAAHSNHREGVGVTIDIHTAEANSD